MSIRAAVISDLHLAAEQNVHIPGRRGEIADILLLRAVRRLNRFIKPDIVLITGDLINAPGSADAVKLSETLRDTLALLTMPYLVIPGNHDLKNQEFYRIFPKPEKFTDVGKVRFVAFDDAETPGYNAVRSAGDLEIMREARDGWDGFLVSVQHVPLLPPGMLPYNYDNAAEVLAVMKECGYRASISGHYHPGFQPTVYKGTTLITVKATCETPFTYQLVEIGDDGQVEVREEALALDPGLKLIDRHVHTQLAYCSENMSIPMVNKLSRAFGLAGAVISEHSGQLYYDRENYWASKYFNQGLTSWDRPGRVAQYLELYEKYADETNMFGLEIDYDRNGIPVVEQELRDKLEFSNGAIHYLEDPAKDFLRMTEAILKSGVDALAHPFRIFRRAGQPAPAELFEPTVKLLKQYHTAAEINYHTNEPEPEFFRLCLEHGVKLTFGSDSHNLYEVGEFYPHLKLLEQIGGTPDDLL